MSIRIENHTNSYNGNCVFRFSYDFIRMFDDLRLFFCPSDKTQIALTIIQLCITKAIINYYYFLFALHWSLWDFNPLKPFSSPISYILPKLPSSITPGGLLWVNAQTSVLVLSTLLVTFFFCSFVFKRRQNVRITIFLYKLFAQQANLEGNCKCFLWNYLPTYFTFNIAKARTRVSFSFGKTRTKRIGDNFKSV